MIWFLRHSRKCKLKYSDTKQISCLGRWGEEAGVRIIKGHRKYFGIMNMFIILIVVMISWLCVHGKTYQFECFQCVQFFMSIVYFNKAIFFKKKKSSNRASYELWPMPWQALGRGNKFISRKILLPEVYFIKSGMKERMLCT